MQRTIKTLVPRRHLRSALLHLPRPCTCPSIPIASRTFMNYAAPRASDTSSSTSSTSSTSPSPSTPPESEEELSMEEKLARHRARVAAGRAKRHAELEAQAAAEAAGLPWPPEGSENKEGATTETSTTETASTPDAASSTSDTASTPSKPSRSSFDIRRFIRSEIHNIREHVKKYSEPPTKLKPPSEEKVDEKQKQVTEEEEEPVSDGKFYAPMTQESDETVWEQRIQRWSERTRTAFSAPFRVVRHTVKSSDNVVVKKIGEAHVKVSDRIEEVREELETTQNPTVWRMREVGERVFSKNETAVTRNEIDEQLPGFNSKQFLRDLKALYIPMVMRWLDEKDMVKLRSIIEKETPASSFLVGFFKGREEDEKQYVLQFINIRKINIAKVTLVDERPWVVVTFAAGISKIPRNSDGSAPTTGFHQPTAAKPSATKSSADASASTSTSPSSHASSSSFSSSDVDDVDSSSSVDWSLEFLHEREAINFAFALCPDTRPENPFGWRIAEITSQQQRYVNA